MHVTRRMRLPVAIAFCISLMYQWLKQMAGKGLFLFIFLSMAIYTKSISTIYTKYIYIAYAIPDLRWLKLIFLTIRSNKSHG